MSTALLLMDLQPAVVDRYDGGAVLTAAVRARDVARESGLLVAYPHVAFRRGYPEVSPRNVMFGRLRAQGPDLPDGHPSMQVHPDLSPAPDEPLVPKRRVSSFAGSDLELLLRSNDVDHVVLGGIATSGVVLSTLRQAADLDLRVTVLADACSDLDPEVHRVLVEKVFPQQATVTDVTSWSADPV